MNVALYARVSTTHQDVQLQLAELQRVADQRGWTVSGRYVDEGLSGADPTRPALERLLADAKAGRTFSAVIVWKLDRLARSLQHLLQVLDELAACKVGLCSLRDPGIDTTTATGLLMVQIIGAFSEFERSMIRERVQAGVDRARAAGKHCGRPLIELDLRAALALLNEGRSLRQTADILSVDRGTLRRRLASAGEWPRPLLLDNPHHAGVPT